MPRRLAYLPERGSSSSEPPAFQCHDRGTPQTCIQHKLRTLFPSLLIVSSHLSDSAMMTGFTNPSSMLLIILTLCHHTAGGVDHGPSEQGSIGEDSGALYGLSFHTVTVNRYGSMCSAPTASLPTSQASSPPHTGTMSNTSTAATQTPAPYSTFTTCIDPVCPALNNDACLDVGGQTYGISCDTTFSGLVAFPLRHRPRAFTSTFTACLASCDAEGGCHGVSYSDIGSSCLLFGSINGTKAQSGSTAARRIPKYA